MNQLRRLLTCLVTIACIGYAAPDEETELPKGREVVISEFPVLPVPGVEGTWVELYNRSPDAVEVGRHYLTYNGRRLVTFPEPFAMPGRSILLVRFGPRHAKSWAVREVSPNSFLADVPAQVADHGIVARVGSGFLALECPFRGGLDRLVDYVRWGSVRLAYDGNYQARAIQEGIWTRGVSRPLAAELIDEDPTGTGDQAERVLSRLSFAPALDRGKGWAVLPAASASPGRGNLLLPSPEPDVINGETRYAGDGLKVRARLPVALGDDGMLPQAVFRFQLARDPHFEDIVATSDSKTPDYTFPEKLVPPGGYYLRVRWLTPGVGTHWSPAVYLRAR